MSEMTNADADAAVRALQDLIRIDTVNPPGNELAACRYLKTVFDREGIPCTILESAPGRGNLVARLQGDGSARPFLLASHLDVVPTERDKWSCDPFSGEIRDGFVWGRGAVDMKQMTALELSVFLKLKRDGVKLKRDVIFTAVADEEAGCRFGSKWLVEHHPELIRAEYAVNEVGGFSLDVENTTFYPIGVAQKGVCWFDIVATGTPGHGAMPHDDQAIDHVCLAAHKLSSEPLPFHRTRIVAEFVNQLAARQKFPKNLVLKSLLNENFSNAALKLIPDKAKARNFKAMLRHIATPTLLKAGYKENVIPGEASVTVDGRILPEHTVAEFLAEVQHLIGPGYRIDVRHAEEPCEIENYDDTFFGLLKDSLKKHDPGCVPVPFLIPGYTDAAHYRKLGIKCYGFAPTKLPPDLNFGQMYHGHDERIPVTAMRFGLDVLWDVTIRACS
jgi:acetylornithine deacetylase/succinyl-diaminopimelate desuccinylase-like protein